MTSALTALFELVKQWLAFKQTDTEHKPTLEAIRDKRALKKATNYTEEIITITDKYTEHFDKKDLRKYNALKRKFNKNN